MEKSVYISDRYKNYSVLAQDPFVLNIFNNIIRSLIKICFMIEFPNAFFIFHKIYY